MRRGPLALELFAGAGGMSLGFTWAGFRVAQAIEVDRHAVKTFQKNHPATDIIQSDIRKVDPLNCVRRLGLRAGDLTALIAGLPCQGFSESNRRTRTMANPKNHLYREFLRFLQVLRPAWFVVENVAGMRTLSHSEVLCEVVEGTRRCGYQAEWRELNSVHFGVPQVRRRIFIIGNRLGVSIKFPVPSHGDAKLPPTTVRDAISDLPTLESGAREGELPYQSSEPQSRYQEEMRRRSNGFVDGSLVTGNSRTIIERYKHILPGQNWEAIPHELMSNYSDSSRCHTGIYYRLKWDEPSKVIGNYRKNMLIHPSEHRGLSVREAARLQSFPDDYVFTGSIGFQQQQVGDAVPPLLAKTVAETIMRVERNWRPHQGECRIF